MNRTSKIEELRSKVEDAELKQDAIIVELESLASRAGEVFDIVTRFRTRLKDIQDDFVFKQSLLDETKGLLAMTQGELDDANELLRWWLAEDHYNLPNLRSATVDHLSTTNDSVGNKRKETIVKEGNNITIKAIEVTEAEREALNIGEAKLPPLDWTDKRCDHWGKVEDLSPEFVKAYVKQTTSDITFPELTDDGTPPVLAAAENLTEGSLRWLHRGTSQDIVDFVEAVAKWRGIKL